ncbi:hypothetical protein chiPu_0026669, partial [Chiloscyllium punctatum]|nr:hypothetical protein [Chiloscyllium punctatum]
FIGFVVPPEERQQQFIRPLNLAAGEASSRRQWWGTLGRDSRRVPDARGTWTEGRAEAWCGRWPDRGFSVRDPTRGWNFLHHPQ